MPRAKTPKGSKKAKEGASRDGWAAIEGAMCEGRLPIIASLGPNEKNEEESFREKQEER